MANSHNGSDRCVGFRDCLANFISNSAFPDDLYPILFSALVLFFTLKMFQYSVHLAFAMLRPIAFIAIGLLLLPHLYELKTWLSSNAVLSSASTYVDDFVQYISDLFQTVCSRISLYPNFSA